MIAAIADRHDDATLIVAVGVFSGIDLSGGQALIVDC